MNKCLIEVWPILIRLVFEILIGYPMSILQNIHHCLQTMHPTSLAPIGPLILEQSTLREMKVNLKSLLSWEQNKGLVFITLTEKNN